jgi:hypothetical protein
MIHSPRIDKIEVLRHGDVRQARLYYLRDKIGKEGRIKERRPKVAVTKTVPVDEDEPEPNGGKAKAKAKDKDKSKARGVARAQA